MKLKEINYELSSYDFEFDKPKAALEQYPTPFSLASSCLFEIDSSFDDICGKSVADLGCGTGVFSIGASILGAGEVFSFDIDEDALEKAKQNAGEFQESNESCAIEFVKADVFSLDRLLKTSFDTVVMNPPFGTNEKSVGVDMTFVRQGLGLVNRGTVYSLHKTASRPFIFRECKKIGIHCQVVAELSFPIRKMYKFHRKNNVDVAVDFIRFQVPQS